MSKRKTSIGFKIIVYTTIIVSAWMILNTLITLKIHWFEIPIGAMIFGSLACLLFLMAGIGALNSLKTGLYLYLGSSVIWLLRAILHVVFQVVLVEGPKSLSTGIVTFFGKGGIWLILSIFGIIVCYHEMKKLHKVIHNQKDS
jgi:hypothetical protein